MLFRLKQLTALTGLTARQLQYRARLGLLPVVQSHKGKVLLARLDDVTACKLPRKRTDAHQDD